MTDPLDPRSEDEPRVVVRDRRRIDPVSGEVRPQPAAPASPPASAGGGGSGVERDEVADLTDTLQRLKAEYDNYRRRVERDRTAVVETAIATVLANLVPILDDLDRAREHGDLTGAFGAVGAQLVSVAEKLGLERYGEPGEPFDPTVHEALMHKTSDDVTGPTAVEVLRPGYRFAGRVVRPAQVTVAEEPEGLTREQPTHDGYVAPSDFPGETPTE